MVPGWVILASPTYSLGSPTPVGLPAEYKSHSRLGQVKADYVGLAFACMRIDDTAELYGAIVAAREEEEGSQKREEMAATILDRLNELQRRGVCGMLTARAFLHRWDSDERYPRLVGVRETVFSGGLFRAKGRTYWTVAAWLEYAE